MTKIYAYFSGNRGAIRYGEDAPPIFFSSSKEQFEKELIKYTEKGHKIKLLKNEKEIHRKIE